MSLFPICCCIVACCLSAGTAFGQPHSALPARFTPSRAMVGAWAASDTPGRAPQAEPESWERLRSVPAGTRVRILRSAPGLAGMVDFDADLAEWLPDAIRAQRGKELVRIERSEVRRVWTLEPNPNHGKRVALMSLIGFGAGFALGYAGSPRDAGAAEPAAVGLLTGAAIGGVAALLTYPGSKYRQVLVYAAPPNK